MTLELIKKITWNLLGIFIYLCVGIGAVVSYNSWLLIYQLTFFMSNQKGKKIVMIRVYIWVLLLLAIAFIKYEWFKQFFKEPL